MLFRLLSEGSPQSWLLGGVLSACLPISCSPASLSAVCASSSSFLSSSLLLLFLAHCIAAIAQEPPQSPRHPRGNKKHPVLGLCQAPFPSLPIPSPNLAAEPVARWQRREGRIYSPTLVAGLFFCCFCLSVSDRSLVASLARSLSSHWFMVPSAVVGQQPAFVQPIATRLFAADHPTIQPSSHPAIQPSTSIANEVVVAIPVRRRGRNADRTRDLRVNCSPPPPPLRLARRLQKLRAYAESCFQTSFSHHLTTTTDIELSRRCGRAERVCDDRTTTIAATRASRKP